MKKLILMSLFLFLGLGQAFADVDIKEGQQKSTSPVKFFVARYGRTGAVATAGANMISKDSIVVWDSVSDDGVSVNTSTTSGDGLVAGITMDLITGSSRDYSAASDDAYSNWGRVQCWGKYTAARWAQHQFPNSTDAPVGSRVAVSGVAQNAGLFFEQSGSETAVQSNNTSRDSVGVTLDATSAGATTMDIFVDRC